MTSFQLQDFVEPLPLCASQANLATAIAMAKVGNPVYLGLVDEQQQLLGLVPTTLIWQRLGQSQEDIECGVGTLLADYLEPVVPFPLETSLAVIEQRLQTPLPAHWVVVNATGQCLGLLNNQRLLQWFVTHRFPPTLGQSWSLQGQYFLAQLLENLPLPLMMQSSQGQAIARNQLWLEQVAKIPDPQQLQSEAAQILIRQQGQTRAVRSSTIALDETLAPWGQTVLETSCHLDPVTQSCVCTCPGKPAQVVQFTAIALGKLVISRDLQPLEDPSRFQLAPLVPSISQLPATPEDLEIWLILLQDLTEQRQIQRELAVKTASLTQLSRLKTTFLTAITHELKTPLTAVLGLSDLMQRQVFGQLSQRQADYAYLIYQSSRQLMHIVNSIVDLTRAETGQVELSVEPVAIASLCEKAIQQARELQIPWQPSSATKTDQPQSHCRLEIDPGVDSVVADPQRLCQMLVHLLSNALKFTRAEEQVGLQVALWDRWVALRVWDSGSGIPAEQQPLIFQKVPHLENSMASHYEGVGLGLALTKNLARLHGGEITFRSMEGQGSEFTILLPHCSSPRKTSAPNRLILVAACKPGLIDTLINHLEALGYQGAIARSGSETLEKIQRLQPAALLLSPILATSSGWEVLMSLKGNPDLQQLPVIMVAPVAEQTQAKQRQADDFLALPLDPRALEYCLTQVQLSHLQSPLTVLHIVNAITPGPWGTTPETETNLNHRLQHHHRVLEADDLEQGELLARIWRLDLVLLSDQPLEPSRYLEALGQHPTLASLPIVLLDSTLATVADQFPELSLFSGFVPPTPSIPPAVTAILRTLQDAISPS